MTSQNFALSSRFVISFRSSGASQGAGMRLRERWMFRQILVGCFIADIEAAFDPVGREVRAAGHPRMLRRNNLQVLERPKPAQASERFRRPDGTILISPLTNRPRVESMH